MLTGAHFLLYSTHAEADRAFIRDVLQFRHVDAGDGWLIFALPPAEIGVHPSDEPFTQTHAEQPLLGAVLYLMCDDLQAFVRHLEAKHVKCGEVLQAEWGTATTFPLPSGGRIGVYQPTHRTAI
ncbi:MAG TPA: VOC family protein [Vicinamibacterales bacterium]|nr:VOC family protein [Vicinamibacterales bacterium]